MSFRQIFDRITRIARAEIGSRDSSYQRELRRAEELIEESRRRDHKQEAPAGAPGGTAGTVDDEYARACRTIGVQPGSGWQQIVSAFRVRAREYHPDRVAHLPEADQRRAHLRMLELNLAYEFLERRLRR